MSEYDDAIDLIKVEIPLCELSFEHVMAIMMVESSGDVVARAKNSTATGLFQITKPAFDDVTKYFPTSNVISFWPNGYNGKGKVPADRTNTMFDASRNVEFFFAYLRVLRHYLPTAGLKELVLAYHYGPSNVKKPDFVDKDGYFARVEMESSRWTQ